MSDVGLAITTDPELRARLAEAAHRAGVFLHVQNAIADAGERWESAELVLLGVDQVPAAARASRRRVRGELIVVGADLDAEVMEAAELVCAAYLVMLPVGEDWLVDRLRPFSAPVIEQLRAARFTVGYADHGEAAEQGFVRPLGWREHADEVHRHVYVMLSDIARGECRAGQSSTVQRSNMRSLHRVFPDVFTDMAFSNVTVLGAFVADLSPEVVGVLCRLVSEYLVFDEDDLVELERQEVLDSWQQWISADIHRSLGDHASTVWDDLDDETREQLWWQVVHGTGAWPEHDTRTVRWSLGRLTSAYAARLIAEGRRQAREQRRMEAVR
ncbi:hypothetical protein [Actinoplanes sp. RD1]|uniref:hypothetical protein n=1 Tax=Actinoplanes sp. RD1 TaxID=3064538 RepID=UPI0027412889|nr:hypothetical protein [Actinoplanes sp. RD1]